MNNKLNQNFSLRKLLLSALVAGPLAVLPAPLWALPSTAGTNLTSSSGVTLSGVLDGGTGALNITAPNKAILTWNAFNVGANDTINYIFSSGLPSDSVLNNVTGGALSTIAGAINSNGNVYLLNPSGILFSKTASINTGGFYASTVSEPSSFFSSTGTLNFTGSASADIGLEADGNLSPTIQAVGSGNNIVLAAKSVLVEGANFYGNVKLQSASNGVVNLAAPATTNTVTLANAQNGGNVNVLKANGNGGNLSIISNGGSVSLTGAPVAVTPTVVINGDGTLSLTGGTGLGGSGYAPNSQLALSITAPFIRQSLNSTTTASTQVGTTAVGTATTNAQGQITGYTITNAGSGYISTAAGATTTGIVGQNVTATATQSGFFTNVAGNTTVDTSGATNGAITNGISTSTTISRFTSAGTTTLTTGTAANTAASGNISLFNANLTTLAMPYVGTVNVIESDGFAVANSKATPNTNTNSVALRATAGNITMASGAKVEIVPSIAANDPSLSLTANSGGVTYSGTGALRITTLTTVTNAASGIANITATGNITVPNYAGTSLILNAAGDITTGTLTNTAFTSSITATGNVTLGANIVSNAKVAVNSGGFLTLTGSNTAMMFTGAGLDLKAVGNISFTSASAGIATSGTDAKIESTAGSVVIPGGFSGAGTITAANNVSIGTSIAATPVLSSSSVLDTSSTTWRLSGGTITNAGGLYTPNSTIPLTVSTTSATVPTTVATVNATTNANGQISGFVVTNPGAGYGFANSGTTLSAPSIQLTAAAPTNAIVAGGTLAIKATNGTVAIGGPVVGTGSVTLTSGSDLVVPSITAPTLSLVSSGAISQSIPTLPATSQVVVSGTTTLNAGTTISLENATNDFGTIVALNSPSGITLKDTNSLIIGNSTDAKGNLSVTAGAGLTASGASVVNIANPNTAVTVGVAGVTSGSVTGIALTTNGVGYTPNTTIDVTFTAPPASTAAGTNILSAASTAQNVNGYRLGSTGATANTLQAVVLASAIGNGYAPNTDVALTVTGTATTLPTVVGKVNGNGQISSIQVTNPGVNVTAITGFVTATAPVAPVVPVAATGKLIVNGQGQATSITITDGGAGYFGAYVPTLAAIPAPTQGAAAQFTANATSGAVTLANLSPATSTVAINAAGAGFATAPTIAAANGLPAFTTQLNNAGQILRVVPVATGGVQIGSATTDTIKVAGGLTIITAGGFGSVYNEIPTTPVTTNYSEITTVASTIAVTGAVTLNTTGANATFGVPTPFGSTPSTTAGSVGGNLATAGALTIVQSNNLNLGAITANTLSATSVAGNITNSGKLAIGGTSEFRANSVFTPGTINLSDTTSTFGGAITIINGKDVVVNAAGTTPTTVTVGSADVTKSGIISGALNVNAGGALTIGVAGTGNLTKVGFSAKDDVIVRDGTNTDGITLENATATGTGFVLVESFGPVTLGSGIKLSTTGDTVIRSGLTTTGVTTTGPQTLAAAGVASSIKDSGANASVFGPVKLFSGNDIALTAIGHSFGPVSLSSGLAGANATTSNVTYTEAGTARLAAVTVPSFTPTGGVLTYGSLVVSSTAGSIDQLAGGTVSVTGATGATNTASFSAPTGSVTLANVNNAISAPVSITTSGNSSITQTAIDLNFSNVAVTAGTFAATTTGAGVISQATGSTARVYGATTLTTAGGKITLDKTGNNFGGLTIASTGGSVVLTEAGTLNLLSVATGAGDLTLTSENASIISTATPLALKAITVGGNTTLSAKSDVSLNTTNVDNNFGGKLLKVTSGGNASIQDANLNTVIAGGTSIGGALTLKNTNAGAGSIKDSTGDLSVFGNVTLSTSNTGSIAITNSNASFGAIRFNSGAVTIYEAKTLNIAAGSTATQAAVLDSRGDIITSGLGGASFSSTLTLSATGNITISNPIFVSSGLTFRAQGTVDLKALSITGNLNSIAPTNLGAGSYPAANQPSP